jgi:hypothetical protein
MPTNPIPAGTIRFPKIRERTGRRSILTLCGQLERDRRNEYRITPSLSRPEPKWIGRAGR